MSGVAFEPNEHQSNRQLLWVVTGIGNLILDSLVSAQGVEKETVLEVVEKKWNNGMKPIKWWEAYQ